jgi:hypothetical protein
MQWFSNYMPRHTQYCSNRKIFTSITPCPNFIHLVPVCWIYRSQWCPTFLEPRTLENFRGELVNNECSQLRISHGKLEFRGTQFENHCSIVIISKTTMIRISLKNCQKTHKNLYEFPTEEDHSADSTIGKR